MGEGVARDRSIGISTRFKKCGPWNMAKLNVFGKTILLSLSLVNKNLTYLRAVKVCLSPTEGQSVNFMVCVI